MDPRSPAVGKASGETAETGRGRRRDGEGVVGLHRRLHLSEMASEGGGGGHGGRRSRTDSGTRSSEKTDGEASEAGKEHGRRTWVPAWWSMEKGLVRRGRARSGEGAEVQGTAPVDVDKARKSYSRSSRHSTERRRQDLAGAPRQQGGAAMAGPDGSGRGRRLTKEGDERQRRSRA